MKSTKPNFNAVVINVTPATETKPEKKFYTDLGASWIHEDNKGLSVSLFPNIAVQEFNLFVVKGSEFAKIADRLDVFVVEKKQEGNDFWHKIGSAFAHSKGYRVVVDKGIFAMNEVVLRQPKPKTDNANQS